MKQKIEQFQDQINRLFYPNSEHSTFGIQGNQVYDITFQVTEDCNLRCTYCYQHEKAPRVMTFDTAKKFIDILLAGDSRSEKYINSWQTRGVVINFIGGEPLLEIDLINQISEYFIDELIRLNHPWLNRFRFNFSSNGTLYFDPKVQSYLKKYERFISLTITIDGNKQLHDTCRIFPDGSGSYDIVHKAVEDWKKHQPLEQTKITISPSNVSQIYDALYYLIWIEKYTMIFINCVYEKGWSDADSKVLYQQIKKIDDFLIDNNLDNEVYITMLDDPCGYTDREISAPWCGGSGSMLCLDPRGDIYPCIRYCPNSMGYEKAIKMKIGDVDNGMIYNAEQENIINEFRKVTRRTQLNHHEDCKNCPISDGCGDCAAYSYEISGQIGFRTNYHCATHIARVLAVSYLKNKSYLKHRIGEPVILNIPKEWALRVISEEEFQMLLQLSEEANRIYGYD